MSFSKTGKGLGVLRKSLTEEEGLYGERWGRRVQKKKSRTVKQKNRYPHCFRRCLCSVQNVENKRECTCKGL